MQVLLAIVMRHGGAKAISGTKADTSKWKAILSEAFKPNTGPLRSCGLWNQRGYANLRSQVQDMCKEYVTTAATKIAKGESENATETLARQFYDDFKDAMSEKEVERLAKEEMTRSLESCERANALVPVVPQARTEPARAQEPAIPQQEAGVDHSVRAPYLPNAPFRPFQAPDVNSHDRTRGLIRPGSSASQPDGTRRRTSTSSSTSTSTSHSNSNSTTRSRVTTAPTSRLTFDDATTHVQNPTLPPGRNDQRPQHRNTVQMRNLDLATQVDNGNTIATSNMDRLQGILNESNESMEAMNHAQVLSSLGSFMNSISSMEGPIRNQLHGTTVPIMRDILQKLGNRYNGNDN